MHGWVELSAAVYYTGAGAVLLVTSVRFLYKLIQRHNQDQQFIDDMRDVHLANIYNALEQIASAQGIDLAYNPPGPKPLVTEGKWIKSGWLLRKM
jgi:hypothetical protein